MIIMCYDKFFLSLEYASSLYTFETVDFILDMFLYVL
jgi:hypothetical protein